MKNSLLSRRLFLSKAAQHAPAAAALAVLPIAVAPEPVAADPIKECERLAAELAQAMGRVRQGSYQVTIDHTVGFALIVDKDFQSEPAHVPADDMRPRFEEVRKLVAMLEARGYQPLLKDGQLFIFSEDSLAGKRQPLLAQLRACDRQTVIEYLEITGRVSA